MLTPQVFSRALEAFEARVCAEGLFRPLDFARDLLNLWRRNARTCADERAAAALERTAVVFRALRLRSRFFLLFKLRTTAAKCQRFIQKRVVQNVLHATLREWAWRTFAAVARRAALAAAKNSLRRSAKGRAIATWRRAAEALRFDSRRACAAALAAWVATAHDATVVQPQRHFEAALRLRAFVAFAAAAENSVARRSAASYASRRVMSRSWRRWKRRARFVAAKRRLLATVPRRRLGRLKADILRGWLRHALLAKQRLSKTGSAAIFSATRYGTMGLRAFGAALKRRAAKAEASLRAEHFYVAKLILKGRGYTTMVAARRVATAEHIPAAKAAFRAIQFRSLIEVLGRWRGFVGAIRSRRREAVEKEFLLRVRALRNAWGRWKVSALQGSLRRTWKRLEIPENDRHTPRVAAVSRTKVGPPPAEATAANVGRLRAYSVSSAFKAKSNGPTPCKQPHELWSH